MVRMFRETRNIDDFGACLGHSCRIPHSLKLTHIIHGIGWNVHKCTPTEVGFRRESVGCNLKMKNANYTPQQNAIALKFFTTKKIRHTLNRFEHNNIYNIIKINNFSYLQLSW